MSTPHKHYKLVSIIGHCAILAQIVGTEPTGEEIPAFFAVCMITKDGKLAVSFGECDTMARISKPSMFQDLQSRAELIGFCRGYSQAAQERRGGMSPQDWTHKQTIYAANVEELHWSSDELKRLKAWPSRIEPDNESFVLEPVKRN